MIPMNEFGITGKIQELDSLWLEPEDKPYAINVIKRA